MILVTFLLLFGVAWLSDALVPFGIALLAAYILDPLVSSVQKRIPNRALAVGVVLGGAFLLICSGLWLLIPPVVEECARMAELLAKLATDSDLARKIASKLPSDLWQKLSGLVRSDRLLELLRNEQYLETAKKAVSSVLPGVAGVLSGTLNILIALFGVFLVAVYLVFMLLDFQGLKTDLKSLIPEELRPRILAVLQAADQQMSIYFRAQAMVSLILAVLFAVGFWAIGMPLGIVLGLAAGISTMVPYLQIITVPPALVLGALHALDAGTSVPLMLGLVLGIYLTVQVLQDWVLVPRILGGAMGLSPVMILLSISVWGKILGVLGLVAAIPFTCLVLAWWKKMLEARKNLGQGK